MKYFYDTEFVEDGRTIDLVSIGIVAEDGREYYAISSEFNLERFMARPWMMENVWPSLPHKVIDLGYSSLDYDHPSVKTRAVIRHEISQFLVVPGGSGDWLPELWAWYGSYDHVALAQLFGMMIDFPPWLPMWTNDLRQEIYTRGFDMSKLPEQPAGKHNALEDARFLKHRHGIVTAIEGEVAGIAR